MILSLQQLDQTAAESRLPPFNCGRAMVPALMDRRLRKDLRLLARFVTIYCRQCHRAAPKEPFYIKTCDLERIAGRPIDLCAGCRRLLAHAVTKRLVCPLDPKPPCKKCPKHCYATAYRAQMREVMRFVGTRSVLHGRFDYLLHLLL